MKLVVAEVSRPKLSLVPSASRRAMWRPPRLVPVCWCVRGMNVYVRQPTRGYVLATVRCMSGYRARLSNPMHGIDGWFHLDSIRVRADNHLALRS